MAQHAVYTFYSELYDYTPTVWRRFQINGNKTIAELSYTLMVMYEMQASHLFNITYDVGAAYLKDLESRYTKDEVDKVLSKNGYADWHKPWRFELPSDDELYDSSYKIYNASDLTLKRFSDQEGTELAFEYDYGDDWRINLILEKCEKLEISATELPRVITGEGFGIIEDCGGVAELKNIANALKDKTGKQYKEYCDWLDVEMLDLSTFDIDDINFRLKKLIRVYKEAYEDGYEPTKKSMDIIMRKYKK